jgi:CO/xanthine dehydrogenase Mo-binding subunit
VKAVGARIERVDGRRKATGQALYIDDLEFPRMLHARVLRSPYPSARILRVETARARALPGVKAVRTATDLPDGRTGPFIKDEPVLARGRVRYIGEPVAAVAAVDAETAVEALSLIEVEYEELPAVFDVEAAVAPDAPLVHAPEEIEGYVKVWPAIFGGNVCSTTAFEEGDIEAGFREAEVVVEDTFRTQMQLQAAMEPSGAIAVPDPSGRVTVYASTQAPHLNQSRLSEALQLLMSRIRVIAAAVGGGFGGKVELLAQGIVLPLAQRTGRPVKLILSREEEMIAGRPRHATVITMRLGARRDGTLVAKTARCLFDTGAYADDGPGIAAFGAMMQRGPYRIPHVRIESHCVYTNKVKTGAFRGFGNPQGTFASESLMDMLAEALGMDPLELRLRNAVERGDLSLGGQVLRSVGFKACLERAAEAVGWTTRPGACRGKGIAGLNHISGLLSSAASIKMNEDGTFALSVGAPDIGQGSDTVLTQIAAEELGVPSDQVSIVTGDTDTTPYNWAVAASRTTYTTGNAVRGAGRDLRRKILDLGGELLEASPADLEVADGSVRVRGVPDRRISYRELGLVSHWARKGPLTGAASLMIDDPYDPKRTVIRGFPFGPLTAYIFGAHAVEVEVDTETGHVRIIGAAAAHDVGRAINPTLVEGQIQGGFIQGVGYALTEGLLLDGGRVTNPSFVDYRVPSSLDAPAVTPIIVEDEDGTGPFGAKGVGEAGLVATAPAIANAIYRAVGVRIKELPITPERVLRALRARAEL